MNGEQKKLAIDLWEIWRDAHDANSKRVEAKVNDISHKLNQFIERSRCKQHSERLEWLSWSVKLLWCVIIVSGIVGISLWIMRGFIT